MIDRFHVVAAELMKPGDVVVSMVCPETLHIDRGLPCCIVAKIAVMLVIKSMAVKESSYVLSGMILRYSFVIWGCVHQGRHWIAEMVDKGTIKKIVDGRIELLSHGIEAILNCGPSRVGRCV